MSREVQHAVTGSGLLERTLVRRTTLEDLNWRVEP